MDFIGKRTISEKRLPRKRTYSENLLHSNIHLGLNKGLPQLGIGKSSKHRKPLQEILGKYYVARKSCPFIYSGSLYKLLKHTVKQSWVNIRDEDPDPVRSADFWPSGSIMLKMLVL